MIRLKKVQGKKKRDNAEAEAKRLEAAAVFASDLVDENSPQNTTIPASIIVPTEEVAGTGDLLSSKDEDVIF